VVVVAAILLLPAAVHVSGFAAKIVVVAVAKKVAAVEDKNLDREV
jgi:hypothetical protein